tara:strand:+ start:410 stop:1060 length:651 start_codon:yes stop_codon:yes gene_type:complete
VPNHYSSLNPEKALIWRITHRRNLPWILANGLHAGNGAARSPDWVDIGNPELIDRRSRREVPVLPGGVLNDYIPFYFTPFSPMMYNIYTGRGGVARMPNADIVILVSSLRQVAELDLPFVFTDRHAYTMTANYFNDLDGLSEIDWPLLQQRNFQRDPNDPEAFERYQAEALIHQHMPVRAIGGAICYTEGVQAELQQVATAAGIDFNVFCRKDWYF